jgi:hypothetical protein
MGRDIYVFIERRKSNQKWECVADDYFAPSVLRISPAWYRRIPRLSFSYRCIGTVDGDALSA